MHASKIALGLVVTLLVLASGCQDPPSGCRGISGLTTDANGNGFPDIIPPDGVVFDSSSTIRVTIENTLSTDDLASYADQAGVSPSVLNLANYLVTVKFFIEYENGSTQTICETEELAPFTLSFEAACPTDVDLEVEVVALAPVVNSVITTIPLEVSLDAFVFDCGQEIEFITTTDEEGNIVQEFNAL